MDVHLMISPVDSYIEAFADTGADFITFHIEACAHSHRTVQAIRAAGCKVGVAINPATPAASIEYLLEMIDMVCVMTVNPGFGGQKFIRSQVEKIGTLRKIIGNRPIHIQIDGGLTLKTVPLVAAAGADVLVAGSSVFRGGSADNPAIYGDNIRAIRAAAAT